MDATLATQNEIKTFIWLTLFAIQVQLTPVYATRFFTSLALILNSQLNTNSAMKPTRQNSMAYMPSLGLNIQDQAKRDAEVLYDSNDCT